MIVLREMKPKFLDLVKRHGSRIGDSASVFSINLKNEANEAGETGSIMAWMYILKCSDGSYYTGSTTNMELRLAEHQQGIGARYTAARRPVKLVYACEFETIQEAFEREHQVKKWNRAKKEAIIQENWSALPKLSERRTPSR